jgi:tRNA threonylcarbamoyladenosine biosynthesis protein TsaB
MVVTGPGSFTGLRVGLSAAKGLCHALEIPIIGVSSLKALAHQHPFPPLPVIPVLDSRKGEVFAAQFRWADHKTLVREKEDVSLQIEKLADGFQVPALFIGNDFAGQSPIISETLGTEAHLAPSHLWNLKASTVGALGLKRYHDRHFDDPHTLKPIYLRPPDIRPNPYGIRSGSGK